jgi:hypothetical protein
LKSPLAGLECTSGTREKALSEPAFFLTHLRKFGSYALVRGDPNNPHNRRAQALAFFRYEVSCLLRSRALVSLHPAPAKPAQALAFFQVSKVWLSTEPTDFA